MFFLFQISFLISSFLPLEIKHLEISGPEFIEYSYFDCPSVEDLFHRFQIHGNAQSYSFSPYPVFQKVGKAMTKLTVKNEDEWDEFSFLLSIVDPVAPMIYGPDTFLFKEGKAPDILAIVSEYYAQDYIDGNLEVKISETDYSSSNTKGNYFLNLFCEDSSKNFAEKKVNIQIISEKRNLIFFKEKELLLEKDIPYTSLQIVHLLQENFFMEKTKVYHSAFSSNTKEIIFHEYGRFPIQIDLHTNYGEDTISFFVLVTKEKQTKSFIEYLLSSIKNFFSFVFNGTVQ